MIGMMYLVLTALLALNISKEVLDSFVKVEKSLNSTQETLAEKVRDSRESLAEKYLSNQRLLDPSQKWQKWFRTGAATCRITSCN